MDHFCKGALPVFHLKLLQNTEHLLSIKKKKKIRMETHRINTFFFFKSEIKFSSSQEIFSRIHLIVNLDLYNPY